jgi:16S rRNA (guanine966-N2)-methyltransferase
MPRIISGSARGTRLATPAGQQTRPTGDKVKEALFSILTPQMPADGFLDLYAGTGQIGLEAASRGAVPVVLVENAPASLAVIRANIEKTHLAGSTELLPGDAAVVIPRLAAQGRQFDLIFLDPPYRDALVDFSHLAVWLSRILRPGGTVILEHEWRDIPPIFVTNLQLKRSCQYGTAMLSFYKVDQSVETV